MAISKAKTSFLWSAVEQFGSQLFSVIITIVIARILTPQDYGLIAMLSIFMALSQIFINSGFSNYLIQNKNRTHQDYNTIFYLNVVIGIVCYGLLFIFSSAIADFYHQPILKDILRVYALILIISSLTLVQRAIIYINFLYKKLSFITIISIAIAGSISIYFAHIGCGVWSLVAYALVDSACESILIWKTTKWHPNLSFSWKIAKKAFSFGSKLLVANILSSSVSNLYTLVIGRKFQADDLGFYSRGQSLAIVFPSNFSNMLQKASYPIFCELQEDIDALKSMFKKYVSLSAFISFPLMMLLFCVSEPLIKILLTDKWIPAVFFLQILCLGSMFDPIMRLNAIILSVTGKTQFSLYSEILKKSILILILFISLPFGIEWVTIGAALYPIFDLIIVSFFVNKIIPFSFFDELLLILPNMLISILSAVFAYFVGMEIINEYFKILAILISFILFYIIINRFFLPTQFNSIKKHIKTVVFNTNG